MVAAVLLLAMSCNTAPLARVLIGETFISARYAMRKKSRKSHSVLLLPRFVKPCRHALDTLPTSAGRWRMIITSNRIPPHVNEKASQILSLYRKGNIKPCHIKCGNLSLKIGRKWRLLSRNNGTCWEVMSHEKYNQLKDRKAQS
ncbi:hypothetical protein C4Y64_023030 [Klebsiella pneumoniae subsp. pneumoniae]|nr:hypothetical protein DMT34_17245 [Klebsiella variicola]ROF17933.1 hypothetical protein C4Y81_001195 [Klebsiella pneumoniae subsp. pneumoniae]TYE25897.1 hypothetical protein DJ494_14995 [Klebsiella pneumoniae]ROG01038.1 hypothetical protein C4Y64_023030 [Klebsiella pneumoniae subsp. pneumoniae]TYE26166.1 hypothetical protein DJ512_14965 [Klebsiella pneumoniae]